MEVFYTSPWLPPEWIKAHGHEPRGIWLAGDSAGQPLPLSAGACSFADTALRTAERRPDSAMIFTTHCDQLRRAFDATAGTGASRSFLFNLPATWQTPVAERIYCDELQRLGRFLIRLGGHAPRPNELLEFARLYDQGRVRLRQAAAGCAARQYAETVARFHRDGSVGLREPGDIQTDISPSFAKTLYGHRIPLALVGGPLPHSQMPLFDAVENAGGQIALNATVAGERSLAPTLPFNYTTYNGTDLLSRTYFANVVDVFQRPNTRLYDWLGERLNTRGVRGIILWHYVGCDLWRAEAHTMREAFRLPILLLEAEDTSLQRNLGRLEAFLESLQ